MPLRPHRHSGLSRRLAPAVSALLSAVLLAGCSTPTAPTSSSSLSASGSPTTTTPADPSPVTTTAATQAKPAATASSAFAADATVVRVVDGDTIVVKGARGTFTVRFLNVDTPETKDPNAPVECLGPEATALTKHLLPAGTLVRLTYDVARKDKYGRDLAVVSTATMASVSVELAKNGLGHAVLFRPNKAHYPAVVAAEAQAQKNQLGFYSPSLPCTPGSGAAAEPAPAQPAPAQPAQPTPTPARPHRQNPPTPNHPHAKTPG